MNAIQESRSQAARTGVSNALFLPVAGPGTVLATLDAAIGNASHETDNPVLRTALAGARERCGALVREHLDWALNGTNIAEASCATKRMI